MNPATPPNQQPNSAALLLGETLDTGWKVTDSVDLKSNGQTGGSFCFGYIVIHPDGRRGFLKAFDLQSLLGKGNDLTLLGKAVSCFTFEEKVLRRCKERKLNRVIELLGSGIQTLPGHPLNVHYIVMELAESNVRKVLCQSNTIDAAWGLRILHSVATGIEQIHRSGIAHRDLKPSNIGISNSGETAKILDFGRASFHDETAPIGNPDKPGDRRYMCFEDLYGAAPQGDVNRNIFRDAYGLGGMVCSLFLGVPLTATVLGNIPDNKRPGECKYPEALPYLESAFSGLLADLRQKFPGESGPLLCEFLTWTCAPDYSKRGDKKFQSTRAGLVYLTRLGSRLDLLASQVAYSTSNLRP